METLKVMSFNFWQGGRSDRSLNKHVAYIRQRNPDIVFLQEIDVFVDRRNWLVSIFGNELPKENQPFQLAFRCGFEYYAFGRDFDHGGGQVGGAILSRFPLTNIQVHPGPKKGEKDDRPFSILEATANIFGVSHRLFNLHPPFDSEWQRVASSQLILQLISNDQTPVLLGGDLNTHNDTEAYRVLASRLSDSYRTSETAAEHCGDPIDYILYSTPPSREYRVLNYEAPCGNGVSDHPVVTVEIEANLTSDVECPQLRVIIGQLRRRINNLRATLGGRVGIDFDPRNPIDREERAETQEIINQLQRQLRQALERAETLGCRL